MGARSRRKGGRIEREIVERHHGIGIDAERVPLSGSAGGSFGGDVIVRLPTGKLRSEVKARKDGKGFATLERWLGDHDLIFLRRDRSEPLVVLPWSTWARLLGRQG